MLLLIGIVLVVWVALAILLAAWTLFFQGIIYNEPVTAVYWRAPAAAAGLAAFIGLWMILDSRTIQSPDETEGVYRTLFEASFRQTETFEHLWIYNRDGKMVHYQRRGNDYVQKDGRRLPEHPTKILVAHKADGDKRVFEPKTDAKGNFQLEKDQTLRYYEKDNPSRYMETIGQISTFRFGWLLMSLLLNFGFLGVWFLVLWLLLRFQWSHALGLAIAFWAAALLFVMPQVLAPAERVRKERLPPRTTTAQQKTRPRDVNATGAGVGSEGMCRIHPPTHRPVYPIPARWQEIVTRESETRPLRCWPGCA